MSPPDFPFAGTIRFIPGDCRNVFGVIRLKVDQVAAKVSVVVHEIVIVCVPPLDATARWYTLVTADSFVC